MMTRVWVVALISLAAGNAGPVDDGVTAEQFVRLVKAQQAAIRDVAFAFEGEEQALVGEKAPPHPPTKIQGRYALRSDGATYLERYLEYGGGRPDDHIVQTMVGGQGEMARVSPAYFAQPNPPVRKSSAGLGSYFSPESPETFVFLWRLQSLKGDADFGWKFLGWEEIDGHRCAHVEFDPHPNLPARVLQELWVDLERGGHPLRIRNSVDGQTMYLVDQIRLEETKLPSGEEIWFPVAGRYSKYHHNGEYTEEPAGRSSLYVLNGTLVFNQGLGDGVFRVRADRFRPAFTPKPAETAAGSGPGSGVDFDDAEKKLDAALADPARQKLARDASATTRAETSGWSMAAWGLGLGGVAALVVAGTLVLRRR